MIVLGIADNHDAGAAVVVDGKLVSAVNQERLDRVKNSGAFPWAAIDQALDLAEVRARDVERVVIGTAFTPSAALRAMPSQHKKAKSGGQFSSAFHAYIVYQSMLRDTGLHTLEVEACKTILQKRLQERPLHKAHLHMFDHHAAHAHGAYRTQARTDCLVFTVDAMGDGTTATVWRGKHGELQHLYRQSGMAGVNTFYSRVTEALGFKPNRHEGKITGLAAYVQPPAALLKLMRTRLHFDAPGFNRLSRRQVERKDDAFWSEVARWTREEVAATAQTVLEESVTAYVDHWVKKTGCPHVAVAGGVFANVKLNQRICALDAVESLWVMPHMGDGGLAVGGALGSIGAAPRRMSHVFLGPSISERDAYKALKRGDEVQDNLAKETDAEGRRADVAKVAQILADGRVVARCDGGMEWGPRALGHRTVLVRCHDPTVNTWLNERLNRSEFMPFAPIVRAEDADRWFKDVDKARDAARFMTVCFDVRPEFAEACPAAVHVDGTARPQLLHREDDPPLHDVLTRVGELTGTPVLVNTSFNLHEEPIVCTASDAVRAYQQARLDGLWLGGFVVERDPTA